MRILLAEDDDFLAGGIRLALTNAGYTVERAKAGPDADHMLRVSEFDLLLLDLGLPKLDGLEVLRHLRTRGKTLPVIILTARDSLEDRVLGLDSGADDYLTKPFELPELLAQGKGHDTQTNVGQQSGICAWSPALRYRLSPGDNQRRNG